MLRRTKLGLAATAGAAALGALLLVPGQLVRTADHFDPPLRTSPDPAVDPRPDLAADIADVFVFHDATNVYFVTTFAGPVPADRPGTYDRDVLYSLNISTSAPGTSIEIPIRWRFGPATNGTGSGIRVEGLPGATLFNRALEGPVEQILTEQNGIRVYAGVRDDPFFFDAMGFTQTLQTGEIRILNTRNRFGPNMNDTAVAISIPRSVLNASSLEVWAATARFGGQL